MLPLPLSRVPESLTVQPLPDGLLLRWVPVHRSPDGDQSESAVLQPERLWEFAPSADAACTAHAPLSCGGGHCRQLAHSIQKRFVTAGIKKPAEAGFLHTNSGRRERRSAATKTIEQAQCSYLHEADFYSCKICISAIHGVILRNHFQKIS